MKILAQCGRDMGLSYAKVIVTDRPRNGTIRYDTIGEFNVV